MRPAAATVPAVGQDSAGDSAVACGRLPADNAALPHEKRTMADDTTGQSLHRDLFGPDLDALLDEATGAFLESWQGEPPAAASDATEVVRVTDTDEGRRGGLLDVSDVFDMASSVILDLLDEEFSDASLELPSALSSELEPAAVPIARPRGIRSEKRKARSTSRSSPSTVQ